MACSLIYFSYVPNRAERRDNCSSDSCVKLPETNSLSCKIRVLATQVHFVPVFPVDGKHIPHIDSFHLIVRTRFISISA
jgi:hypothetical protein